VDNFVNNSNFGLLKIRIEFQENAALANLTPEDIQLTLFFMDYSRFLF